MTYANDEQMVRELSCASPRVHVPGTFEDAQMKLRLFQAEARLFEEACAYLDVGGRIDVDELLDFAEQLFWSMHVLNLRLESM